MVQHSCHLCNYTTIYKTRYDDHLRSARHINLQSQQPDAPPVTEDSRSYLNCPHCDKKYSSKSCLQRHMRKSHKKVPLPSALDSSLNAILSQQVQLLERVNAHMESIVAAPAAAPVTINNNTINNNNTTNNTLNVVCMNNRFGEAMGSNEFIDNLEFNRRDFEIIDKCRFYVQGAHMVLENKMEGIPKDRRPIRTGEVAGYDDGEDDEKVPADTSMVPYNKDYRDKNPGPIYIRDHGEWTAECPAIVEYHLRNNGCSKPQNIPRVMHFLMQYGNKIYDTYQKMKPKDESLKRIDDKMMQSGRSQTHIELLYKIRQSKCFTVDPPETSDTSGGELPAAEPVTVETTSQEATATTAT